MEEGGSMAPGRSGEILPDLRLEDRALQGNAAGFLKRIVSKC